MNHDVTVTAVSKHATIERDSCLPVHPVSAVVRTDQNKGSSIQILQILSGNSAIIQIYFTALSLISKTMISWFVQCTTSKATQSSILFILLATKGGTEFCQVVNNISSKPLSIGSPTQGKTRYEGYFATANGVEGK